VSWLITFGTVTAMKEKHTLSFKEIRKKWHFPQLKIKVAYNAKKICPTKLNDPYLLYYYFMGQWDDKLFDAQEHLMVLFMNRSMRVIGHALIGKGNAYSCICHVKLIASIALLCAADCIVMAHNHPGGTARPSPADKKIFRMACRLFKMLDLPNIDSLVLSRRGFYSLKFDRFFNVNSGGKQLELVLQTTKRKKKPCIEKFPLTQKGIISSSLPSRRSRAAQTS
jgi:DNA repair protein RadC